MAVEVVVNSSNEWDFLEPEPTPNYDTSPSHESLSPIERRTLLTERLRCLSQELSSAQDRYDQCILRRIAASALGHIIDDSEFQAIKATINQLVPERLACISAISDANQTIRHHGIDTRELSAHLARIGYQNPALTDREENLFDLESNLAERLIQE